MTRQVLIIGYGMAGARLAEELRRRDPLGARLRVTVLGAEPDAPYNRVLLAEILSGTLTPDQIRLHPPGWPHRHQITAHRATTAASLDPTRREVTTTDGTTHPYDDLVLATGATPRLPTIPGLTTPTGAPAPGVTPLRTLADTRHLLSLLDTDEEEVTRTHGPADESGEARRDGWVGGHGRGVVVLGGGVLGLEAARALAGRGIDVTVVHASGHVMNRQLDRAAGRLLGRLVRGSGIRVVMGESAARWEPGEPDGAGRALVTDRGTVLPCRALVVAAGAAPASEIAREAGIAVRDGRGGRGGPGGPGGGIVVDDRLATSVPGVWAIGDCAWHEGASGGFVAPAWEQAAVLADLLSGTDPAARYEGSRVVTRLKDHDIHLTTVGDATLVDADPDPDIGGDTGDGDEVVVVSEGARGRYVKLVVREGRVAGAILLGVPDAAAGVVQLFDRGDPVPADRLAVALGRAYPEGGGGGEPVGLGDESVICRCNTVTKGTLVTAWRAGATAVAELATATRATTGCGSCGPTVAALCAGLRDAAGAGGRVGAAAGRGRRGVTGVTRGGWNSRSIR